MIAAFALGLVSLILGFVNIFIGPAFLGFWGIIALGGVAMILGIVAIVLGVKHKGDKKGFLGVLFGGLGGGMGFALWMSWAFLMMLN